MSYLLQNGHVYSLLRERIAFRAPSFHLAVEIQSVMQTMQVCLINTYNVCVERNISLGKCEYKNTQCILQPPAKTGPTVGFKDKSVGEWSKLGPNGLIAGRLICYMVVWSSKITQWFEE